MLFALSVILLGLLVWRVIWPLKVKWYFKVLPALPLAAGALKFQWFLVLGGHFFAPDLPDAVILGGAWLHGAFYFLVGFWLICEAVRLFFRKKAQSFWNRINLGLCVAAGILSALALAGGAAEPRLTRYTVELKNLPPAAEGMTIVFLTDLHVDHTVKPEKIARLVKRVNALKPHLIALGGDLMDGSPARCGKALAELDKLDAPLGVFGVPGNHEFYSGLEPWLAFFRRSKVRLLFNESVRLPNGVYLAGTGDKAAEHFFDDPRLQETYGENVPTALAGIPEGSCTVLLAHRPKTALNSAGTGVGLQISGHTHGGMVLGLDLLVALFNGGWVSGRYEAQGMTLLVSNGTWLWRGFPLRLGRPGEILLITLKRP